VFGVGGADFTASVHVIGEIADPVCEPGDGSVPDAPSGH
jgi:hypothetical protein